MSVTRGFVADAEVQLLVITAVKIGGCAGLRDLHAAEVQGELAVVYVDECRFSRRSLAPGHNRCRPHRRTPHCPRAAAAPGPETRFLRVVRAVQLPRKTALVPCFPAPMLLRVAAGGDQITSKKPGGQQGRGRDFRVGQKPPVRGLGTAQAQKIVIEAVHCHRLFCHGI